MQTKKENNSWVRETFDLFVKMDWLEYKEEDLKSNPQQFIKNIIFIYSPTFKKIIPMNLSEYNLWRQIKPVMRKM